METLWGSIPVVFAILSFNNAVFGQNVPAALSLPPVFIRPGIQEVPREIQDGSRTAPSISSFTSSPTLNSQPIQLSHPCTVLSQAPALPLTSAKPPTLNLELPSIRCPLNVFGNQFSSSSFQQTPIFDNIPPNVFLPEAYLQSSNFPQNLPPSHGPATVLPSTQQTFVQVNTGQSSSTLSQISPQLSSLQSPQSYPAVLSPGTATIISSVPQYPSSNIMPIISDVNTPLSGYQVMVLPAASPVQTTSESVASTATYYAPLSATENSEPLPINMQGNYPEQPVFMPLPMPPPPAPIIVVKSGSSWKNWLPALLVSLFTRCNGCCGCENCGSTAGANADNVYVPYPIAVPTNNPIILGDGASDDDYEEEECED